MNRTFFFIYFLLLFSIKPTFASYTIHKAYKMDLSNNAILCMHQDSSGYMWFGTYDGLNFYNGKDVFIYRFEMGNPYSLCSNIIHKITQADKDNLWISTFLGLNKFSLREKKVTESYTQYPEARYLMVDSKGNTWAVCKSNYISYYTPETKTFVEIHLPGVKTESILTLFVDKKDRPHIVMKNGSLKQIKIAQEDKQRISVEDIQLDQTGFISAFYTDGKIYLVNFDGLFSVYDPVTSQCAVISDVSQLTSKYGRISEIVEFQNDIYLSFNMEGIIKLDSKNDYKPESIGAYIGIFCMLKDRYQDLLWMGTDGQGIQMYYNNKEMFRNVVSSDLPLKIQKPIRSIYTDEENNLWIGTKGDGVLRLPNYNEIDNYQTAKYAHYTTDSGLSNNSAFCFLHSQYRDILWIGTNGPGLSFYSYRDKDITTLDNERIGKVHSICEVNAKTLWLATAGGGLLEVILNDDSKTLSVETVNEFFLKNGDRVCNEFHSMIYDGFETLHIGSRGGYGVARFNIITNEYHFIKTNKGENSAVGDVLSVHNSRDSIFYIGASSGITKVILQQDGNNIIEQFDRKNGLANDMIHGILEAEDGCIWFSSNKGLIKYNPHNNFFHNYAYPELEVTEFSDDAYWKDPLTNRLFFGGINGLVWIEPDKEEPSDTYAPDLQFFDIKISGESYPLEKYTNNSGAIELPSSIHSFTISFVARDYINGDNYEYSYSLDNFNTEWVELQKNNEATFTNLPFGNYLLKVRYKNDVFGSDESFYSLPIIKLPPWYFSKLAVFMYIILIITICTYVSLWIRNNFHRKQMRLARKIKEEEKEKLFEAKLMFFTNVTHEFCTPLTVINGITEHISNIRHLGGLDKYIKVLKNNVNSLNELIQEILDFRKIEVSNFKANDIRKVCISDIIRKHLESFDTIVEENNINLILSIPNDLEWTTDTKCFKRIIINLISNAFKYTDSNGEIQISATIEKQQLVFKIYNTGDGIEETRIPHIFDRYCILDNVENPNSYSRKTTRNGIGLFICNSMVQLLQGRIEVNSKVNEFTEFTVYLPLLDITPSFSENPKNKKNNLNEESFNEIYTASKPTILVVDDNKDIVWMIQNILSENYTIKGVYNGVDAIEFLEKETPALIITDIMMPGINGLELINELRTNKFARHIPVIIISAKISEAEQAKGIDTGADAYLTKPFSSIVLRSMVNRILTKKEELKGYYNSPESAYEYSGGNLLHQDDKNFMDSIIRIIEENIEEENLRPELIADKLGINTRNLYRKFKKITSTSPNDFIKDYRFKLAAKLLVTTNLTTQEIIYKIGINNKSYFYREFVKKYKLTPKEYRSHLHSN